MRPGNHICIECLCNVCKCDQHRYISYSIKGRIPARNASKKEWNQFIEIFLSYDPKVKEIALKTLNKVDND